MRFVPGNSVDAAHDPGDSELQRQIIALWEECLKVRPIGSHDNFFALGGDAHQAESMLRELDRRHGFEVSPSEFLGGATAAQLTKLLRSPLLATPQRRLVEVQKGSPDSTRIFFAHGDLWDGGFYCRNLARHMGREQGFVALQPHGLEAPFAVPGTIEEIAVDFARAMLAFQSEGPYILGGHCNGALIAYEIAQQLQKMGKRVEWVILVAPMPQLRPQRYSPASLLAALRRRLGARKAFSFHHLPRQIRSGFMLGAYGKLSMRYRIEPFAGRLLVIEAEEDMLAQQMVATLRNRRSLLRLFFGRTLRKIGWRSLAQKVLGPKFDQVGGTFQHPETLKIVARVLLGERAVYPDWQALGEQVVIEQIPGGHNSILHSRAKTLAECIKKHVFPVLLA